MRERFSIRAPVDFRLINPENGGLLYLYLFSYRLARTPRKAFFAGDASA
jgi:hypothetical protein